MIEQAHPDGDRLDTGRIEKMLEWMADGSRSDPTARRIIDRVCRELVAAGIPISRFALFIFTLHPNIGGRRFIWTPDEGTVMNEASHEVMMSDMVQKSPAMAVMRSGEAIRERLNGTAPLAFSDFDDLRAAGVTDYLLQPLGFTTGDTYAASWATEADPGFSDEMIATLTRVRPLLARLTETYILRLNAANLLSAYVGRDGGERILAGHVQRGDTEAINAAILFADFKGFTALSTRTDGKLVIETLDRFFDILVLAIEGDGGEVLKFLGDGILAIFPVEEDGEAAPMVAAARRAVEAAADGVAKANAEPGERPELGFRAGLCLGDVLYGNIGGGNRLDFTAIGPAVNLASRLLQVASETGRDFVCSSMVAERFADAQPLGEFDLKGIEVPTAVFALPLQGSDRPA